MVRPLLCAALVVLPGCTLFKKEAPQCPAKYADLPKELLESGGECSCPLGLGGGPVWGGGVYTQDSSVCRAAVHAGAIDPAKGGAVKFKPAPGCARYSASTKHEVTTTRWKQYPASFYFPGFGEPSCPSAIPNECPDTFLAIPNSDQVTRLSCNCDGAGEGSVWGSGPYTRDSAICRAALHAGAMKPEGGKVTVRAAPACVKYRGSERHGVKSGDWGAYPSGSFSFEDFGSASCEVMPTDLCPDTFLGIEASDTVSAFSCGCPQDPGGSVWGTDVYTRDSSLCAAAKHAGALKAGGKITVYAAPPCQRYQGSERNGVGSSDWAAYEGGSFVFREHQRCAE